MVMLVLVNDQFLHIRDPHAPGQILCGADPDTISGGGERVNLVTSPGIFWRANADQIFGTLGDIGICLNCANAELEREAMNVTR